MDCKYYKLHVIALDALTVARFAQNTTVLGTEKTLCFPKQSVC